MPQCGHSTKCTQKTRRMPRLIQNEFFLVILLQQLNKSSSSTNFSTEVQVVVSDQRVRTIFLIVVGMCLGIFMSDRIKIIRRAY